MFTGIVEELGEILGREDLGDSARLTVLGPLVVEDAKHGDSIAVNGVCLTVVDVREGGVFTTDVMGETLARSSLDKIEAGAKVKSARRDFSAWAIGPLRSVCPIWELSRRMIGWLYVGTVKGQITVSAQCLSISNVCPHRSNRRDRNSKTHLPAESHTR